MRPIAFSGHLIVPSTVALEYGPEKHKEIEKMMAPAQPLIEEMPPDVLVRVDYKETKKPETDTEQVYSISYRYTDEFGDVQKRTESAGSSGFHHRRPLDLLLETIFPSLQDALVVRDANRQKLETSVNS